MFRRNRRTPGRHTEAYLSRRATSAAAEQATVETTEALPEAIPHTPAAEAEGTMTPAQPEMGSAVGSEVETEVGSEVEPKAQRSEEHTSELQSH